MAHQARRLPVLNNRGSSPAIAFPPRSAGYDQQLFASRTSSRAVNVKFHGRELRPCFRPRSGALSSSICHPVPGMMAWSALYGRAPPSTAAQRVPHGNDRVLAVMAGCCVWRRRPCSKSPPCRTSLTTPSSPARTAVSLSSRIHEMIEMGHARTRCRATRLSCRLEVSAETVETTAEVDLRPVKPFIIPSISRCRPAASSALADDRRPCEALADAKVSRPSPCPRPTRSTASEDFVAERALTASWRSGRAMRTSSASSRTRHHREIAAKIWSASLQDRYSRFRCGGKAWRAVRGRLE